MKTEAYSHRARSWHFNERQCREIQYGTPPYRNFSRKSFSGRSDAPRWRRRLAIETYFIEIKAMAFQRRRSGLVSSVICMKRVMAVRSPSSALHDALMKLLATKHHIAGAAAMPLINATVK